MHACMVAVVCYFYVGGHQGGPCIYLHIPAVRAGRREARGYIHTSIRRAAAGAADTHIPDKNGRRPVRPIPIPTYPPTRKLKKEGLLQICTTPNKNRNPGPLVLEKKLVSSPGAFAAPSLVDVDAYCARMMKTTHDITSLSLVVALALVGLGVELALLTRGDAAAAAAATPSLGEAAAAVTRRLIADARGASAGTWLAVGTQVLAYVGLAARGELTLRLASFAGTACSHAGNWLKVGVACTCRRMARSWRTLNEGLGGPAQGRPESVTTRVPRACSPADGMTRRVRVRVDAAPPSHGPTLIPSFRAHPPVHGDWLVVFDDARVPPPPPPPPPPPLPRPSGRT